VICGSSDGASCVAYCRFICVCAVGAVANVGIASYMFASAQKSWLAGLVGFVIGAVLELRRFFGIHMDEMIAPSVGLVHST
jgi:hypothetical protein